MMGAIKTRTNKARARAFGLRLFGGLIAMLLAILWIAFQSGGAYAQDERATTGTLRGAVTVAGSDGQTYRISGANVKLKGTGRGAAVTSNDAGEFEFKDLSPGTYILEVSAEGFKTASKSVALRAGDISVENINLNVAQVTETVTVTSGVDGIEKTEAAPATTVTRSTLQILPLASHHFLDALPHTPAVCASTDSNW